MTGAVVDPKIKLNIKTIIFYNKLTLKYILIDKIINVIEIKI